ncbi:CYTH domain-containing protein [Anatilimnocola aggregata]|nr:hypothetical protein [Anatilimnocola aggregata]
MADFIAPKYSLLEIERRWLVNRQAIGSLDPSTARCIEDLYIAGSQLRLRKMTSADGNIIYKLGKKYGATDSSGEPVTNLYLTAAEHAIFDSLPGDRASKVRYLISDGALDVYEFPRTGFTVFEREFNNELAALRYLPPSFVVEEITQQPEYSGAALAAVELRTS